MLRHRSIQAAAGLLLILAALPSLATGQSDDRANKTAKELLTKAGVTGGLIVQLGCGDGALTAALHRGSAYVVQGLDTDKQRVQTVRESVRAKGKLGPVSIDWWDGQHLPYTDNLVNLIIVNEPAHVAQTELQRALAPNGILLVRRDGQWQKTVKQWPAQFDQWTHYLHGPDGNPVAQDTAVGPPRRIQWLGDPKWARHHDHMASMTSLVSANGRLFYILDEGPRSSIQLPSDWQLIARDAFNGTILWKQKIAKWNTRQYPLKSGPAHLLRRLVAEGNRVYVTLGIDAPVSVLDAATGEVLSTFADSQFTREIVVSAGTVFCVADSSPSPLPKWNRVSTYVWDNTRRANPELGWQGTSRRVLAYDAATGKPAWNNTLPVAPCSLAADGDRVVLHDGQQLVCIDQPTGQILWKSAPLPTKIPVHTNTGPRILLYEDVVLAAPNNGKITAFSATDGSQLWEQKQRPSGHMSLRDLMVVNNLVWTSAVAGSRDNGVFVGYDVHTGEKKVEFSPDVNIHWFHHRCYPAKASGNYVLMARNGTEYVDVVNQHWEPNHWVRGGCIYGVMPCNGLTYAPMDACGCQMEAKLEGFKALAAGPVPKATKNGLGSAPRLQKGQAYGRVSVPPAGDSDWPTYRHDAARSGSSVAAVPTNLGLAWQADLGARPTPPVVAGDRAFVATPDNHTVHALDARTGKRLWSYAVAGRVDSPPTYYQGLVLFGSADGHVYALSASEGTLAWRFRAAPVDRRVMIRQQLESAWPVHGSVLIHNGVLYCTAGRNMFLEGGIHFLRLNPETGELLGEVVMDDHDPESGEEMQRKYLKKTQGNNMPVALSDILSCDGRHIWMRSQKIALDGKRLEIGLESLSEQPADDCHLFCQAGFLDDSWFFRTYWTYGRRVSGGYGAWMQAGRLVPSGRILCVDDKHVYGFGRKPEYMVNSSVLEYELFAADKAVTQEAINHVQKIASTINRRSSRKNANSSDWLLRKFFPRKDLTAAIQIWSVDQPSILARAMALSKETMLVAGPPQFIDERQAYRRPNTPDVVNRLKRQQEAMEGKYGGELWTLSKQDGKLLARVKLDAVPVFDGMAVTDDRLYISTTDGRLLCLADSSSSQPLPAVEDRRASIAWNQPEDPSYLVPLPEPKEADFANVQGCRVVASKLGYRLTAQRKQPAAVAVKSLPQPLTGTITFRTRMKSVSGAKGLLSNGYLAFGDGGDDAQLIKCGVRIRAKQALVIQGLVATGTTQRKPIEVKPDAPIDLIVRVDLDKQQVTMTANGLKIQTQLERPLERITHLGYVIDNAAIDFAPIEVNKK